MWQVAAERLGCSANGVCFPKAFLEDYTCILYLLYFIYVSDWGRLETRLQITVLLLTSLTTWKKSACSYDLTNLSTWHFFSHFSPPTLHLSHLLSWFLARSLLHVLLLLFLRAQQCLEPRPQPCQPSHGVRAAEFISLAVSRSRRGPGNSGIPSARLSCPWPCSSPCPRDAALCIVCFLLALMGFSHFSVKKSL